MRVSSLLGNDTDAANDTLRITAVSDAVNGRAFLDGTTVTYKHDGSETITGSFTYTLSDRTASGLMTIDVTPVNDPPTVISDTATVEEGTALSVAVLALLSNDADPGGRRPACGTLIDQCLYQVQGCCFTDVVSTGFESQTEHPDGQ